MNLGPFPECSKYVGVPYVDRGRGPDGWDCYGLVYYVNNFHLGRPVPSYWLSYPSATDDDHVQSAIAYHCREWVEVERGDIAVGDTLVFNLHGLPVHCGIVYDAGRMLHCLAGRETVLERFDSYAWTKRLQGVFRWK